MGSGELFCLHLAITGAQTLSTNLALKVGQLSPTQLRDTGVKYIIYTLYDSLFYIKTHSEDFWSVKRQVQVAGRGYNYTEIRTQKGLPHTQAPSHVSRQDIAMLCNQTQKLGGTIWSQHLDIAIVCQEMCV